MRVALVCPYDWCRPGGVQSHVRELSRALEDRGHEVTVVAPTAWNTRPPGERGFLPFGRAACVPFNGTQIDVALGWGRELRRLKALLREVEVVHHHTFWNPFVPLQVRLAAPRAVHVATFHDVPPTNAFGRLCARVLIPAASYALNRWWLKGAAAVSRACLDLQRPRGAVEYIPNGVSVASYANRAPFEEYRDGRFNVLFLGRLEERKGARVLLEAWQRLGAREARLIVAGDGPLRADLEHLARLLANVEFVGRVSDEDKLRYFASADLFCSPALYGESQGIVLLEAMASGVPPVAAANAGYRTVLTGPGAQLLVPPGSAQALAEKLRQLIADVDLRRALAAWGREEARRYDWPVLAERVEAMYLRAAS